MGDIFIGEVMSGAVGLFQYLAMSHFGKEIDVDKLIGFINFQSGLI